MFWLGWLVLGTGILAWIYLEKKCSHEESSLGELLDKAITERPYPSPFLIEKSQGCGRSAYAFIDLQTTGLSIEKGQEDRIVQLSWLVTDADYRELGRGVKIVYQESLGSVDARRVHRVTAQQMSKFSVEEGVAIDLLLDAIRDVPVWVFHNARFDLAILLATVRRVRPALETLVLEKDIICTMSFVPVVLGSQFSYPSLIDLSAQLTNLSRKEVTQVDVISWRNVCLTRVCLKELIDRFPNHQEVILPASEFVSH